MTTEYEPQMDFSELTDPSDKGAMFDLDEQMRANPDLFMHALGVVALDRNIVSQVLKFVEEHPEGGVQVIRDLQGMFDSGTDTLVDFDKTTNKLVKDDATIRQIRADRSSPDLIKGRRTRIRRFQILASRYKAA